MAEEEITYTIQFQASSNSSLTSSSNSNLANEGTEPFTDTDLLACDLALSLSSKDLTCHETKRQTTLTSCTCLFPCCWRLPCRHMIRLYVHKQIEHIPEEVLSQIWFLKTDIQMNEYIQNLYISHLTVEQGETTNMTRDDRFTILCADFKNLAGVASISQENTNKLRETIKEITHKLIKEDWKMSRSTHQDSCIILNPKSAKGKGRPVQKRKKSAVEQPKYKKKQRRNKHTT